MKYWRGYIVAGIFAAITLALTAIAKNHTALVDMIYPYTTRLIQTALAEWTSMAGFCLWQLIAVVLVVVVLATLVLAVVLRWNLLQWTGWILALCSFLWTMHTGLYGLNTYAGSLSEDIRLTQTSALDGIGDLVGATEYYLEIANELSTQINRDENGDAVYPSFQVLSVQAAEGFDVLVYDRYYSVFAGSTLPVKELDWADMYTSMGITGVHMPLTGEAAVNPQTPAVALPFTMCHEMCHRMCISVEQDANMGAFLACDANSSIYFRYSGYFMAFRYCYNALRSVGTTTSNTQADRIYSMVGDELMHDWKSYSAFFAENQNKQATSIANTANDTYIKASGDSDGVKSYSKVADLLVGWYVQEIYLPAHQEEEEKFDPTDKTQVDLQENVTVEGAE